MHKNNNMMLIFYRKSVESPDYSYTYSDIKITVKHEKTSAEFLLLRFSWCHRHYFSITAPKLKEKHQFTTH